MTTKSSQAKQLEGFDGTLIEAKSIIDSYSAQLSALEARISPMEQVIAARDQEIKDLKVERLNQNQLKTALEREKLINSDLRAQIGKLNDTLRMVGVIAKGWTVQAKMIKQMVRESA